MRVPPSVWPPLTQLLSVGTSVRRVGEEWFPKELPGGVTGSPELDNVRRGSGTRDTRTWRNPHNCRGFSDGGCTASQWKKYAQAVMLVEAQEADEDLNVNLVFTKVDL